MKQCKLCNEVKPHEEFYVRPRMKDGRSNWCLVCERAYYRERGRNMTPEERAKRNAQARARGPRPKEQVRNQKIWSTYRVTPERFAELLERQGGRCAIPACGATEPGGNGNWHIDHDHSCCPGKKSCGECVRGLLCSRCNPMLGMARDDKEILRSAVDYLENFSALQSALGAIGG